MKQSSETGPELREWWKEMNQLLAPTFRREDWAAIHPTSIDTSLQHPVKYIVCSYIQLQKSVPKIIAVQQIQHRDMVENKLSDIQCNFVIHESGTVFEGRGWHIQPGRSFYYPGYEGNYIEIAFIGDYSIDPLKVAFKELIETGVKYQYLSKNFQILTPEHRRKDVIAH